MKDQNKCSCFDEEVHKKMIKEKIPNRKITCDMHGEVILFLYSNKGEKEDNFIIFPDWHLKEYDIEEIKK